MGSLHPSKRWPARPPPPRSAGWPRVGPATTTSMSRSGRLGQAVRFLISRYTNRSTIAPSTDMMNPGVSPGWYRPAIRPP